MSTATMAAGMAAALLAYAVERGAPRDPLLRAAGLSEADLVDQDRRIPVHAYQQLAGAAMAATGDAALLLRHTMASRLETMSVVGQIVHTAASFRHSIEQLNRYLRLMTDMGAPQAAEAPDRFELVHDTAADAVWIIDHLRSPGADAGHHGMLIEVAFARFISEFRRSFPEKRFAMALELAHAAPPHALQQPGLYADLFGVPVRFGADRNALRIDPLWLTDASPFQAGHAYAFGIFTRHADGLLQALQRTDSVRARVEAEILPELHQGNVAMDRLAQRLGMSRQTLHRRLKAEGVTFSELLDALRHRMAVDYLGARKVSVNETAYLLGFSEASAFVRAFRRWTGRSPTAYLSEPA